MACRHSALLGLLSALGALGRRFESCRPDSNNPSHRKVSQPVFFIGNICPRLKWTDSGQI